MKASVIIPVYNVRPYLERCVHSVLRQTFKDMEIILVDDGSKDESGELADKLATLDTRIQVIHQKNQGLSGARNTGLRAASGEYVVFLDSDDEWLLDDGIETLFKQSEPNSDLIVFKRVDIMKQGRRVVASDYDLDTIGEMSDASSVFNYLVRTQQFQMSACFLLIRRRLLIDKDIFFPVGQVDEDITWSLRLWQFVQTVSFHNLPFYGYWHRAESITTSFSIRAFHSNERTFSYWEALCKEGCVNKDSILTYLANIWVSLGYHLHTLKNDDQAEAINILKRHKDLLRHAGTPKARRTALMVKTFGVRGTTFILGLYWYLRAKIKGNIV